MRAHRKCLLLSVLFALAVSVSQASAQMCSIILGVEGEKHVLAHLVQTADGTASDAQIEHQLQRMLDNAETLSGVFISELPLRTAVAEYLSEIQAMRTTVRLHGPIDAARRIQSSDFRHTMRTMNSVALRYCDANGTNAPAGTPMTGDPPTAFSNISRSVASPLVFFVIITLGIGANALSRRHALHTESRTRFDCNIPVTLQIGDDQWATEMIDLSALGARITKPATQNVEGPITLVIEKHACVSRILWQNETLIGLGFVKPLPVDRVRTWINTHQKTSTIKDVMDQTTAQPSQTGTARS